MGIWDRAEDNNTATLAYMNRQILGSASNNGLCKILLSGTGARLGYNRVSSQILVKCMYTTSEAAERLFSRSYQG